jgi:hypothetical protein
MSWSWRLVSIKIVSYSIPLMVCLTPIWALVEIDRTERGEREEARRPRQLCASNPLLPMTSER